jgi:hypothetical protein
MGVQLGEAFHEESLERAALPLAYDERVRALVLVAVALAATGAANAAVPPPPEPVQLTRKNQSGHEFVLSRQSQRVF